MSKDYCSKIIYASTAIFQISGATGGSNFHGEISPPPSKKKNKNKKTWVPWGNCNYSILIPYFKRNQKLYLDIWLCYVVVGSLGVPGGLCPPPPPSSPFTLANSLQKCVIFSPKKHTSHMLATFSKHNKSLLCEVESLFDDEAKKQTNLSQMSTSVNPTTLFHSSDREC